MDPKSKSELFEVVKADAAKLQKDMTAFMAACIGDVWTDEKREHLKQLGESLRLKVESLLNSLKK